MATEITPTTIPGKYPATPVAADAADFAFANSDSASGNEFRNTGKEIVLASNNDAAPQTITITSQPDEKNRLGTISAYSVGVGEYAAFGPFPPIGWNDSGGKLQIATSDDDLQLAVLRFTL